MSEYYAVTRSTDHLAHYGVKGMKWGVRRAVDHYDARSLGRHYAKASRKLQKLTAKTDKELISKTKRNAARKAPGSALLGGLASGLGTFAINSHLPLAQRAKVSAAVGGGMALANGIASGIENLEYRRMLSKKGYAKNMAKRKNFEKEMRNAFKGTKYARQIDRTKRDISRKLNTAKQLLSDPGERAQNTRIVNKPKTNSLSKKQRQDVNRAIKQWADSFEKHYQTGLSRGMTHEQAERYSNNYIAKNGFGSSDNKRRKSR